MFPMWKLLVPRRPKRMLLRFVAFLALTLVASLLHYYVFTHLRFQNPFRPFPRTFSVISRHNAMKGIVELHSLGQETDSFLVHTSKCKIPHVPTVDFAFWDKGFPKEDTCALVPNLTYVDYQDVVINTTVLKQLGNNLSSVTCCYRTILRGTECGNLADLDKSDDIFCDSTLCHPMSHVTRPTTTFIRVICRNSSNSNHSEQSLPFYENLYENFHMVGVLPSNDKVLQQKLSFWRNQTRERPPPLNVLILGLDATSRLNAHRNLPRTLQLLRDIGAVEMRGYNKVASNTLPCLIPLLSSYTERELMDSCAKGLEDISPYRMFAPFRLLGPFDKCPWVWKEFSRQNYITAYFEDQPIISIFSYLKKGFVKRPADIYTRPWMMAAYSHFAELTNKTAGHCLGYVTSKQAILQQVISLARLSHEGRWPFFSFAWMTHVLHDSRSGLGGLDVTLTNVITELRERKILENTLLVVMGDHGYHWHPSSSGHGWFEGRLPLLFLRLPERLVEQHPQVVRALQNNARQLITTFDLHATLKDVLAMMNTSFSIPLEKHPIPKRGLSLLRPLPDRSCQEVGIPWEYCTCGPLTTSPDMAGDVDLAAHFIADYINAGLPKQLCQSLQVHHTVGYAEIGAGTKKYIVALKLTPGDMVFEALVTFNNSTELPDMVYDLRRVDSYKQAHIQCLNQNETLKLMYEPFCYCKNQTDFNFWENVLMSVF